MHSAPHLVLTNQCALNTKVETIGSSRGETKGLNFWDTAYHSPSENEDVISGRPSQSCKLILSVRVVSYQHKSCWRFVLCVSEWLHVLWRLTASPQMVLYSPRCESEDSLWWHDTHQARHINDKLQTADTSVRQFMTPLSESSPFIYTLPLNSWGNFRYASHCWSLNH